MNILIFPLVWWGSVCSAASRKKPIFLQPHASCVFRTLTVPSYAGAAGDPLLDTDGNGYGTMLELGFGLTNGANPPPKVSANGVFSGAPTPGTPAAFFDSSTSPRLVVAVYRSKEAMTLGATYFVEFSSTLGQWDRAVSYTIADSGTNGDIIHVADPNPGPIVGDGRFYRVGVFVP